MKNKLAKYDFVEKECPEAKDAFYKGISYLKEGLFEHAGNEFETFNDLTINLDIFPRKTKVPDYFRRQVSEGMLQKALNEYNSGDSEGAAGTLISEMYIHPDVSINNNQDFQDKVSNLTKKIIGKFRSNISEFNPHTELSLYLRNCESSKQWDDIEYYE